MKLLLLKGAGSVMSSSWTACILYLLVNNFSSNHFTTASNDQTPHLWQTNDLGFTYCSFPTSIPELEESGTFHIWVALSNLPKTQENETQLVSVKGFMYVHGDKSSFVYDHSNSPQWNIAKKFLSMIDKFQLELRWVYDSLCSVCYLTSLLPAYLFLFVALALL
jgi:hypothetical protein